MGKRLNLFLLVLISLFFLALFLGAYKAFNFLNTNQPVADPENTELPVEQENPSELSEISFTDEESLEDDPDDEEIDLSKLDEILGEDDEDLLSDTDLSEDPVSTDTLAKSEEEIESPEKDPEVYQTTNRYYVVAGSFKEKTNANNAQIQMKKLGYENARVIHFAGSAYTTVILDNYSSQNKAKEVAEELKLNHNIEAYVRQRKLRK